MEENSGIELDENLYISRKIYLLTLSDEVLSKDKKKEVETEIMEKIKQKSMTPLYNQLCNKFNWYIDEALIKKMTEENETKEKELDEKLNDAEENLGITEVRDALLAKAEYFASIGDVEKAKKQFQVTWEKTTPSGQKMDIVFSLIRLGFFAEDYDLIKKNIEKAKTLVEQGGDWDRRNRLKAYHAAYLLKSRDFSQASALLVESLPTFTCYELFNVQDFVRLAVLVAMVTVGRVELREKVIDSPEVIGVLVDMDTLRKYLNSFYDLDYQTFFECFVDILDEMRFDALLGEHVQYYAREMRIVAYNQFLESYKSIELKAMSEAFGVSEDFIDKELSRFIANGRLHCKIDRVGGVIETTRPDSKNAQYQIAIKKGDLLLNRVQKLSRVINL